MQGSILNADLGTMAGWFNSGLDWWLAELRSLLPQRFAAAAERAGPVAVLGEDGVLWLQRPGRGAILAAQAAPGSADLAVNARHCLERDIGLPAMSLADLRHYVALEQERLFPLQGAALLCDALVLTPAIDGGQQLVRIGAVRRDLIEQALERASATGLTPVRIGVCDEGRPGSLRFDFARVLRAEARLPRLGSQRQIWWAMVAALVMLNVALMVWRDQQSVARLQAVVDEQQPAVLVYRAIASRSARAETLARTSVQRRQTQQPLDDLAAATAAVPPYAWVQRYAWNGRSMQLAGYYRGEADLLAELRKSPRFAGVRATTGDVQADIPIGHPFDISIDLRWRR